MLKVPAVKKSDQMDGFLPFVHSAFSDEIFINTLEDRRGRGRNDYTIELLWKALLSGVAGQVSSVEQMRRKMKEQPDLFTKIPSAFSFSRFFTFLCGFSTDIEALFFRKAHDLAPEFGCVIAVSQFDQIHFLWESESGLPLCFQMALPHETNTQVAEKLIDRLRSLSPVFSSRIKYLLGSSSYEGLIKTAWDRYKMRAIIPLSSSQISPLHPHRDALYDEQGMVYCQAAGGMRAMVFAGFEEKRNALKYRCMARHYGTECKKMATCPLRSGLRIPISLDERIFTPLPRTSYRWGQIYSLYRSQESVIAEVRSHLQLANNDMKKILFCRVASVLLLARLLYSRIKG
ncbi:MAG: transposase, family [Parachlamydiales bacterium]|nr:transposase, family [Parachlamydiales bacterium]